MCTGADDSVLGIRPLTPKNTNTEQAKETLWSLAINCGHFVSSRSYRRATLFSHLDIVITCCRFSAGTRTCRGAAFSAEFINFLVCSAEIRYGESFGDRYAEVWPHHQPEPLPLPLSRTPCLPTRRPRPWAPRSTRLIRHFAGMPGTSIMTGFFDRYAANRQCL